MDWNPHHLPYQQTGFFSKIITDYLDGAPATSIAARFGLRDHVLQASFAEQLVPFNQLQSLAFEIAYQSK